MPPPWAWVPPNREETPSVGTCTEVHCPQDFSAAVQSPVGALSSAADTLTHRPLGLPLSLNLHLLARFTKLRDFEACHPRWQGPTGLCWPPGQEKPPSSGGLNPGCCSGRRRICPTPDGPPRPQSSGSSRFLQMGKGSSGGAGSPCSLSQELLKTASHLIVEQPHEYCYLHFEEAMREG